MENSMQLITKMWAPLAMEYAKFLNRYKVEHVMIVSRKLYTGLEISIFADENEYLQLSQSNIQFKEEEKQLAKLFEIIENLWCILRDITQEENDCYSEDEDEG